MRIHRVQDPIVLYVHQTHLTKRCRNLRALTPANEIRLKLILLPEIDKNWFRDFFGSICSAAMSHVIEKRSYFKYSFPNSKILLLLLRRYSAVTHVYSMRIEIFQSRHRSYTHHGITLKFNLLNCLSSSPSLQHFVFCLFIMCSSFQICV